MRENFCVEVFIINNEMVNVTQLSDRVYEIPVDHVRVFILEDIPTESITLVDTGFDRTADELVETLVSEFGDIDYVILTHDGPDHYGGLDRVVDRFSPELITAAEEETLLEAINQPIDRYMTHGDVLFDAIEVIQIAGHSPCPSALLLRDEGELISSDILDGADRRGLPEGYLLPPPEIFNWDHAAAESGLDKLLEYDFETVYVFHGSHVLGDAKTKLDKFINFREHYRE